MSLAFCPTTHGVVVTIDKADDRKPLRVLYVTSVYKPAYIYGGPTRSIPALCEGMERAGADVTVFTTNANGSSRLNVPVGRPLDIDGVRVSYFPLARNIFFYSPELASACWKHVSEFDIVTIDSLFGHALGPAAQACVSARVPYVVPLRGQLLPWSLRQKRWKKQLYLSLFGRRCLNGAASLHCTDAAEAEAASALGLRSPTFIVPNGLDLARYQKLPSRGGFRKRLGIPPDSFLLLFFGRLHHKKRPDIAIEALSACQRLPQGVHLALVGPDEVGLAKSLHAQAKRLSCLDRLHITGLLQGTDVLQALVDSDLMLMPSEPQSENFGMSALEALAAGVPIVASTGVPVGHWGAKAGAGRMVSCTVEAFTRTTKELLADPQQLKAMGTRGRLLVRQEFDIEVVAQRMIKQLQGIVTRERALYRHSPS